MQARFPFFLILFRKTVKNTVLLVSINTFPTTVGNMSVIHEHMHNSNSWKFTPPWNDNDQ